MSEIKDAFDIYRNLISSTIYSSVNSAEEKSVDEMLDKSENDVKNIFYNCVEDFYNSYTPKIYKRNRSMHNILNTSKHHIDRELIIDYIPSAMSSSNRNFSGQGLYDLVFKQGWHGGALRGKPDKSGKGHPGGGAYWRTGAGFSLWGEMASKFYAPLAMINEELDIYEDKTLPEELISLLDKNITDIMYKWRWLNG